MAENRSDFRLMQQVILDQTHGVKLMNTKFSFSLVLSAAMVALALGAAAYADDRASALADANGTWAVDVARSDFSKQTPPVKSITMSLTGSSSVRQMTEEVVFASGKSEKVSLSTAALDRFYPVHFDPVESAPEGLKFAYLKDGSFALKNKSGKIIETSTWSLSSDGQTMTIRTVEHTPNGDMTHTTVWDKTK